MIRTPKIRHVAPPNFRKLHATKLPDQENQETRHHGQQAGLQGRIDPESPIPLN